MNKQYSTAHQGLAAFFVIEGQKITDIQKKELTLKGKKVIRPVFTFYMSNDEGKKLADEFFSKTLTIEPCGFYEKITELRAKVFELNQQEAPVTV